MHVSFTDMVMREMCFYGEGGGGCFGGRTVAVDADDVVEEPELGQAVLPARRAGTRPPTRLDEQSWDAYVYRTSGFNTFYGAWGFDGKPARHDEFFKADVKKNKAIPCADEREKPRSRAGDVAWLRHSRPPRAAPQSTSTRGARRRVGVRRCGTSSISPHSKAIIGIASAAT